MNKPCGCCAGIEVVTPQELLNRPGLSAIAYRVGTHTTFLESMLARLSSASPIVEGDVQPAGASDGTLGGGGGQGSESVNADGSGEGGHENKAAHGSDQRGGTGGGYASTGDEETQSGQDESGHVKQGEYESAPESATNATPATVKPAKPASPLSGLRTRQPDDPSIALLDAWATVADVLTFYQERVANEGYLRTAVERRSVVELARLLGYRPRPGVASSVYLAFTLQGGFDVTIPAGTAALTTPGPGELPQTFETSGSLDARADWNELRPRRTQPQRITLLNANDIREIYFDGVDTRLKPNDRLLLVFGDGDREQVMRAVESVSEDQPNKRTRVTLQVEEFSAARFAIDVQRIVQAQINICPKLKDRTSIKNLLDAVQKSSPLFDMSTALKEATDDLAKQQSDTQTSVKDLTTIQASADKLSTKLAEILGRPHKGFADNVLAVIEAYSAQETHATKVSDALNKFVQQPTTPRAPSLAALLAADKALLAEAVETSSFKALAAAITNHRSADWKSAIADTQSAVNETLGSVVSSIDQAITLDPPEDADLMKKLGAIKQNFTGVKDSPADEQTAQVEQADADLKDAKANNTALRKHLNAIKQSLTGGLSAVSDNIVKASGVVNTSPNPELRPSHDGQVALKAVSSSLSALKANIATAILSEQFTALTTTTALVHDSPTAGSALIKLRFQELSTALSDAPGKVVKNDMAAALDAITIPDVTDVEAKKHKATTESLIQPVHDAADSLEAISTADTAVGDLKAEFAAIGQAINSVKSDEGCFKSAVEAFTPQQTRFGDHFKKQFQAIHDQFEKGIPNTEARPVASEALEQLQTALGKPEAAPPPLLSLVGEVGGAIKKIEKTLEKVPPTDSQLKTWFNDLLSNLNAVLSNIKENQAQPTPPVKKGVDAFTQLRVIASSLLTSSSRGTPTTPDLKKSFGFGSDAVARSLLVLKPELGDQLLQGWGNIKVDLPVVEVYAFRVRASLFGFNAPKSRKTTVTDTERPKPPGKEFIVEDGDDPTPAEINKAESNTRVDLDATYDQVVPSSWVAVLRPAGQLKVAKAGQTNPGVGGSKYGMTGKTTEVPLTSPKDPRQSAEWFTGNITFNDVRGSTVWAQAERLALAEEPITDPVGQATQKQGDTNPAAAPVATPAEQEKAAKTILLDGYFDGLKAGRFVAVTGERTDVAGVSATELARIAAVEQNLDTTLPGDTLHTRLLFTVNLQHQYKRETVKINANVAHATHGETRKEVLGSGDGGQSFQTFKLSKVPLTYLSKPTPSGAQSTLAVRVNDILWHEADNLAGLGPNDRKYTIDVEDDGATFVVFGDGVRGGRLPTGTENVRSVYRSGIGKPGNVVPTKISILPSPPLGVTAVSNPSPATGGADPETRDQARRNAPVAVLALDRLVSVRDYADFARTFAGIAKANASLAVGVVTVTIAGIDDIPIEPSSDLFNNLFASLEEFGDPHQAVTLRVRKLKVLVLQMGIVIHPDYDFNVVKDKIRAALLDRFGFDQQELGEPVILSQIISVSQRIAGVEFIDVELFGAIPEIEDPDPNKIIEAIDQLKAPKGFEEFIATAPNEITYFSPALPETIVLKQVVTEGNQ
jgi:hypothetical protein